MATIGEIAQEQSYHGDPGLGGGYNTPVLIDTKPLEDLARYTMIYHKAEYDQREKDAQEIATKMADMTGYDLLAIPEESAQLRGLYDDLYKYVKNDPSVMDYKHNQRGWLEYNKKKNDFEQVLRSAKARNVVYEKRKGDIAADTNPGRQALSKKQLDDDIKSTNINIPLPAMQTQDITPVTTTAAKVNKFTAYKLGDNQNILNNVETPNFADAASQANAIVFGLDKIIKQKDGTPEEKKAYDVQVASGSLEPVMTAKTISEGIALLPLDANGKRDYTNAPDLLKKYAATVDDYNKRADQELTNVSGLLDVTHKPIFNGQSGVKKEDYAHIDRDTATADGLLKIKIIAQSPTTSYGTTVQETKLALGYQEDATARRGQNLAHQDRVAELNQKAEEWTAKTKGTESIKSAALIKAQSLYDGLVKLADSKGFISPDKVRQMDVEQLRYFGLDQPEIRDEKGYIIQSAGLAPLDLTPGTDKKKPVTYGISLDNGNIRVIKNPAKDLERDPTGTYYYGTFDNTKSTNIRNAATNIVNEENTKAGSKEINNYMPSDLYGAEQGAEAATTSTSGGETQVSGKTKTKNIVKVKGL